MKSESRVVAILGPTNTGKTRFALDQMLSYRTGVIGLPLRLLAREIYDKTVKLRGPSCVALITGEERIVPDRPQYWIATTEAMPVDIGAEFLAVDEIQLCSDPERGHVFTDRLLHARGLKETMFMGSATMHDAICNLIPGVRVQHRERLSRLSYSGRKKIARMKPRSAIVGFSVDEVYAIAEWVRQMRGGAAVVMGALSPRTRNAQVRMYQDGEVDFLVATDAIGMGLNLDVDHVAFTGLSKFDGRRVRQLRADELAQIAGRAGRFRNDGTFGETARASLIDADVVSAIENNRFDPVRRLQWRNGDLDFDSVANLIVSLEAIPSHPMLCRAREADDVRTLKSISAMRAPEASVTSNTDIKLLWAACQVPDFRQVSFHDHVSLVLDVFLHLRNEGEIPESWLVEQINGLDRTDGDIDDLSRRLAFIRTWTYVVQRRGWTADEEHWRARTREIEDRISDVLHLALTSRFVDRRASVLMKRLVRKESLMAEIDSTGNVSVEEQHVGQIDGFRFKPDPEIPGELAGKLTAAARQALTPELARRARNLYSAGNQDFSIDENGRLIWKGWVVGRLELGADVLAPVARAYVDESAGQQVAEMVQRRLQHFVLSHFAEVFAPLVAMRDDETIEGLARGVVHRLFDSLGVVPRSLIADEVRELDQEQRKLIRRHGVRFGQKTIFVHSLLKPAATRLRLLMWALKNQIDPVPAPPTPGLVVLDVNLALPRAYYSWAGFKTQGKWALRVDMWERVTDLVRVEDQHNGFEASADMLSLTGMSHAAFAEFMEAGGFAVEKGERVKQAPRPETSSDQASSAETKDDETDANDSADAVPAEPIDAEPAELAAGVEDAGTSELAASPPVEATDTGDAVSPSDAIDPTQRSQPETATEEESASEPEQREPEGTIETFYVFRRLPPKQRQRGHESRQKRRKQRSSHKNSASSAENNGRGANSRFVANRNKKKNVKKEPRIDPSNPFAVLASLKDGMSEKP